MMLNDLIMWVVRMFRHNNNFQIFTQVSSHPSLLCKKHVLVEKRVIALQIFKVPTLQPYRARVYTFDILPDSIVVEVALATK